MFNNKYKSGQIWGVNINQLIYVEERNKPDWYKMNNVTLLHSIVIKISVLKIKKKIVHSYLQVQL